MNKQPRIAVLINGNLDTCRFGQINSALCRAKNFKQVSGWKVDVFCVQDYDWGVLRRLRKVPLLDKRPTKRIIDGVPVKILYKKSILIDYILESILKITPLYTACYYRHISKLLRDYDLISGHSIVGGQVALAAHQVNGTPYVVTWHGTDIHTYPKTNRYFRKAIGKVLKSSAANIFVSQALLDSCLETYSKCSNVHILYNAPDINFKKFNEAERTLARHKWGAGNHKVVAFVGNLIDIKNVQLLPDIFRRISGKVNNCVFWIIGNGCRRTELQTAMEAAGVKYTFFGSMAPGIMPELMNCIDALILPSKNESFGMVLVEAIACGANAVGSNRGGIPEVIGKENCFDLDESFADKISERMVYMLHNEVKQTVNADFNWTKTAKAETEIYKNIIK